MGWGSIEIMLTVPLRKIMKLLEVFISISRGFNGSVNIPESCDFRSQFDPLSIICKPFFLLYFIVGICILNENV